MADVKPYVMIDNIMSKTVAIDFFTFLADCFNYCGIFGPHI